MTQLAIISVPIAINGHRNIMLAIRTPSEEDEELEALLDVQVYEQSAGDSDLDNMELLGSVLCICQDQNDPDKRLYMRAHKDVSGIVDDEIFLPTGEGYPVILAGPGHESYTSDDLDDEIIDILPDAPWSPDEGYE